MEQAIQEEIVETEQATQKRVKWLTWIVIALAIPPTGWVTTIQLTQQNHGEKISNLEHTKKAQVSIIHQHDLRLQRIEDANAHVQKSLERIEKHLGTR